MKIVDLISERCRNNNNKSDLLADVEKLIASGADVNEPDDVNMTTLHIAVSYSLHDVAQKLLDSGADVDAVDDIFKGTPLHHAVKFENLEMACMLLCYGADVSVVNHLGMTPLMYAIDLNASDIAKVLLDYYDDLSYSNDEGYSALLLAIKERSPLAVELLTAGADVNCVAVETNFNSLSLALMYDNVELFDMIWPKFDCRILLEASTPFLSTYLNSCCFPLDQWLECLYSILDSPFALDFVEHARHIKNLDEAKLTLLLNLLTVMYKKRIESDDRSKLICILLSLGIEATFLDIAQAHRYYGFEEEVTALLYVGDYTLCDRNASRIHVLPTNILALNRGDRSNLLYATRYQLLCRMYGDVRDTLKFFSLNARTKNELSKIARISKNNAELVRISRLIESAQEVPSLMELCRDKIRLTILESDYVQYPYEFHDNVRSLRLPQLMTDIIVFRAPIYNRFL